MSNLYNIESTGPNVLTVRFSEVAVGWDQWILLSSDRHHDNIRCRRDIEAKHLKQAQERGALIADFGDLFCAMQGKYDPRSSLDDLRPEDKGAKYLDLITVHAAEDYGQYAPNWLLLSSGNHETSILNRHHTDLTSNLAHRLNSDYGAQVHVGGFGGWIRFLFSDGKRLRATRTLKYFHGSGSEAPVTRGVIQTNRQAVYLPDADIVVNGHNHNAYVVPIARERLTEKGRVSRDIVYFVRTPGYKDDYGDGSNGWAVERGSPPKPLGCVWLHFVAERYGGSNGYLSAGIELIPAVE